jgi:glycerophosphoryl diester phosphodiesterase
VPARISVHGHRGARAILPENSLAGFDYAIRAGVDAIELDVTLGGGEVLFVSHDPVSAESNPPTLAEVLVLALAAPSTVDLAIDVKSSETAPPDRLARLVLHEIRQHALGQRSIVQSFDFRILHEMSRIAPDIRLAALIKEDTREFADIAAEAGGVPIVSAHQSLVILAKVAAAHAAGLSLMAWTVNGPKDWDAMIASDVNAIVTDDPAALIAYLSGRSG